MSQRNTMRLGLRKYHGDSLILVVALACVATACIAIEQKVVADEASSGKVETNVVEVDDVVVDFREQVDVPALQSGAVDQLNVQMNQFVRRGEVLGRLDAQSLTIRRRAALLRFESAKLITEDDLELKFAQTSLEEAEAELEASQATEQKYSGTVAVNQLRRMRLAVERAKLEVTRTKKHIRQAEIDTQLAAADLALIDDELSQLACVSPLDGVVLTVHQQPGEWIAKGQPWVTIASVGELTLHALVNADELSPATCIGLPVTVHWGSESDGTAKTLTGKVTSVDPKRLPGNRFRLHAEVVNRRQGHDGTVPPESAIVPGSGHRVDHHWQLLPGAKVSMRIYRSRAEMAWRLNWDESSSSRGMMR
ncbi:HlyD family secretion protein [Rhodopirellula halodulae]|uniref:HlyD family secretion protein n=1 Tax=Rhodopirellula halodulae TaxID=2894198 RepID=UPI001E4F6712|nr:HlyD family efflux transporter periplasmic adaptor subunit [Rhodopirellula sp. JC737]MCC9655734.1 HlyD family efflux transporter periplasmic adaptor subunit [Rhodopirellula sp. JC737]